MENKQVFDKLSKERRKELRTMFPSDKGVYLFKLLNGSTVPTINKDGEGQGKKTFYPRTFIRTIQRVSDGDGENKTIAALKSYVNGEPRFHQIMTDPVRNGFFSFREDIPEENDIIDFLLASNDFKNNPNRSKHEEPVYEIVDKIGNAKHKNKIASDKSKAYQALDLMEEREVRDFSAAMGWDETEDLELLQAKIYDLIEMPNGNGAGEFIRLADSPELEQRSVLKRALDKGIMTFSQQEYAFDIPNTGTKILLSRVHNKTEYDQWVTWLKQGDNGLVLNTIKQMLNPTSDAPAKASGKGKAKGKQLEDQADPE